VDRVLVGGQLVRLDDDSLEPGGRPRPCDAFQIGTARIAPADRVATGALFFEQLLARIRPCRSGKEKRQEDEEGYISRTIRDDQT